MGECNSGESWNCWEKTDHQGQNSLKELSLDRQRIAIRKFEIINEKVPDINSLIKDIEFIDMGNDSDRKKAGKGQLLLNYVRSNTRG